MSLLKKKNRKNRKKIKKLRILEFQLELNLSLEFRVDKIASLI